MLNPVPPRPVPEKRTGKDDAILRETPPFLRLRSIEQNPRSSYTFWPLSPTIQRLDFVVRIAGIEAGSIAEELQLEIGTRIVRINGERVRDGIDLTFLLADTDLIVETVSPSGDTQVVELQREEGEAIGIVPAPDAVRECANECVFCFIDGNPKDARRSLWLRDDDFRLSFTYGSYVTLTNLGPKGLQRLVDQKISPLYVSVHATEPEVRIRHRIDRLNGQARVTERFDVRAVEPRPCL